MAGVSDSNKAQLIMKQIGKPFNDDGILKPLSFNKDISTQLGVVFPYTPTIMIAHAANYGNYDIPGSVYQQNYYQGTPNATISVTALFSANTIEEAKYTAAALHFFKACTKSDFGAQAGATAGTPPPILKFSCYGSVHAKNVPVILRSFNYTLPEDTDYVTVEMDNHETVNLPTLVLAALELSPQLPPKTVKDQFNIRNYASGKNLNGHGGFI